MFYSCDIGLHLLCSIHVTLVSCVLFMWLWFASLVFYSCDISLLCSIHVTLVCISCVLFMWHSMECHMNRTQEMQPMEYHMNRTRERQPWNVTWTEHKRCSPDRRVTTRERLGNVRPKWSVPHTMVINTVTISYTTKISKYYFLYNYSHRFLIKLIIILRVLMLS